ncbi:NUDIX domain-containing protein [Halobacillus shinanisalinarum]|uniref:NUDIX domain-containing protein n=1 Tax=Halobacillus shinanisalinarum TaxID=2932258 RepID=UPI0021037A2A|nr:NUDIX domain-containing protein [Halobacillus shinanisalinarum]
MHRLSRGVILKNGHVLLARAKGYGHTFLPGGHVEMWEGAEKALIREIKEELGITVVLKGFIGDIEHEWMSRGRKNVEINHLFKVELKNDEEKIFSKENHLEFIWVSVENIHKYNLQPQPLVQLLKEIDKRSNAYWISTLGK